MIRIKYYFFLLLLFCFCQKNLLAQNKVIDSLLVVLKTSKEDTSKVNILNLLSRSLSISNTLDRARLYADSALVLADKLGYKKVIKYPSSSIWYSINIPAEYCQFYFCWTCSSIWSICFPINTYISKNNGSWRCFNRRRDVSN